jgi:hypothetical protein
MRVLARRRALGVRSVPSNIHLTPAKTTCSSQHRSKFSLGSFAALLCGWFVAAFQQFMVLLRNAGSKVISVGGELSLALSQSDKACTCLCTCEPIDQFLHAHIWGWDDQDMCTHVPVQRTASFHAQCGLRV